MGKYGDFPSQTPRSEIKICNLHPKTRRRVSPFFFIWESPTEDYLIFEEPVGYEGTKKWYRQHRARDTLGERGARGIVSVTAFQNLASQSHYILYPIDNYVLS